jgi:hypothetical protein
MTASVLSRAGARKNRTTTFKRFSRAGLRLRNLERVIRDRHGRVPDTDDADVYLIQVAHCFRQMAVDRGTRVTVAALAKTFGFWCEDKAPRFCREQVEHIARDVIQIGAFPTDDECAGAIRLTYAERTRSRVRAIGSIDADRATRTKIARANKKERDRINAAKKRAAAGATPRAKSLSRTEPWKAEGISRSTWERRRKKAQAASDENSSLHTETGDANSSPHPSYNGRRICVTAPIAGKRRASGRRRADDDMDDEVTMGGVALARRLTKTGVDLGGVK